MPIINFFKNIGHKSTSLIIKLVVSDRNTGEGGKKEKNENIDCHLTGMGQDGKIACCYMTPRILMT